MSARVFRGPAAAHRRGAGAGAAAPFHRAGRGHQLPRRFGAVADSESPARSPGTARADLPVHHPRPQRGPPDRRSHRGNAPGNDRRDGQRGTGHRCAPARIHSGIDCGGSGSGGEAEEGSGRRPGRIANIQQGMSKGEFREAAHLVIGCSLLDVECSNPTDD